MKWLFAIALFAVTELAVGQTDTLGVGNMPMNRLSERAYQLRSFQNKSLHTSVKPYFKEEFRSNSGQLVVPKKLQVALLSDLEFGFDGNETNASAAYHIGAGLGVNAQLGKKWGVQANYLYGMYDGPSYIDSMTALWRTAPSFGLVHASGNANAYHQILGSIHFKANKFFTFQFGNGKNFIGDGHRTLLLSDVANNYPYFKITTKVWNIKYTNLFTRQRHIYRVEDDPDAFRFKYTTTHFLDWNISKRVSVGLFETIVWQAKDTLLNRGFDFNYLNPIIFYRPVEFQQGSADNALMGVNASVDVGHKTRLYAQLMIDEFLLDQIRADSGWWANKYGGQIGVKSYDVAGLKGLDVQTELSAVRPFTLSHGAKVQNYGHDNGSLAHPYGANYWEWLAIVNYQKKHWVFELQTNYALHGRDSVTSISNGGNIFQSYSNRDRDYHHRLGQGLKTKIFYTHLKASYPVLLKWNLRAEAGYVFRHQKDALHTYHNHYFYVGLKSNLWNRYNDY